MNKQVPNIAEKILKLFLPKREREFLLGDYAYLYEEICNNNSKMFADLWYWTHVFKNIPVFFLNSFYWGGVMFASYLKITLRNLKKSKIYSFINITGLAVGIACCIFILLWVQDELSYDTFHTHVDNLYRVARISGEYVNERTPMILAPTLMEQYPEIENVTRYRKLNKFIKNGDKYFNDEVVAYAEPSFFEMFDFDFIQGNQATCLKDNSSILLSSSCAEKIFGSSNPIGQLITVGGETEYIVTGIFEDYPKNSHLSFDCIVHLDSRNKKIEQRYGENSWRLNGFVTYVLLKDGVKLDEFNMKINDIIKRHRETSESEIYLQTVTDINLNPLEEEGNKKYLYIFSIIAFFVLAIACINFMNLSTARSGARAKEIGMRKVIGANRFGLIKQFLGESLLLTIFSVCIAIFIVILLLPYFNNISGKEILLQSMVRGDIILILAGITIFTTLFAGGYPAFYLSSLMPLSTFKSSLRSGKFAELFRKYMVIAQFAISIILTLGVTVVYKQLAFMVDTDLGYNKEHTLYFHAPKDFLEDFESIRSEYNSNPNILNSTVGSPPMFIDLQLDNINWEGKNSDEEITFAKYHVDYNYVKTLDMQILEGRDFSKEISSDVENAYIINEEAARTIGYPVLNKEIVFDSDFLGGSGRVIGVVKDFHNSSFHEKILPMVLDINRQWVFSVIVNINSENIPSTINFLEDVWKSRINDSPFHYTFFDEEVDNFYKKETRMAQLLGTFSGLAIILACLGLFGLITFVTEQRTKEIGIRKILGSQVSGILFLLTRDFIKWVVIANVIAWPVAFYLMNMWLDGFAYRVDITLWVFILSAIFSILISFATISFQTIKAAGTNPVDTLRYE